MKKLVCMYSENGKCQYPGVGACDVPYGLSDEQKLFRDQRKKSEAERRAKQAS